LKTVEVRRGADCPDFSGKPLRVVHCSVPRLGARTYDR
jgi:hypothetical protein